MTSPKLYDRRHHALSQTARRAGEATGFGVIGLAVGQAIAVAAPSLVGDSVLFATTLGGLFAALNAIGVLEGVRRSAVRDVAQDLREIDLLFLDNQLDEDEYWRARQRIIDKL
ncbi:MAG TPA: hypothetical protein VN706_21570 [Gemmatimonadaceae bacterium]|nr:hypothetical protein [Gemmatimonadaceae bacterium]